MKCSGIEPNYEQHEWLDCAHCGATTEELVDGVCEACEKVDVKALQEEEDERMADCRKDLS